jgi:hypothetical protein
LIGLRDIIDHRRFLHRNTTKFYGVITNSIPHNCTKGIVKTTLEEVVTVNVIPLSRKTARSPEGNVDVEPPSF